MDEDYLPVRLRAPSRADVLFDMARSKSFPFCILKLEEKEEGVENPITKVQVNSELYNFLKEIFKSDEIMIYCSISDDNTNATFGAFSSDMVKSHNFLNKLGIVKKGENWIKEAQNSVKEEL